MPLPPRLEYPRCWGQSSTAANDDPSAGVIGDGHQPRRIFPHGLRRLRLIDTRNWTFGWRHDRDDREEEEEVTEWVYARIIWLCCAMSACALLCSAIFCFQLLKTPMEIAQQMERNQRQCESSMAKIHANFSNIQSKVAHRTMVATVVRKKGRKQRGLFDGGKMPTGPVPLWDAEGTFCCIPGPPGKNGKNGVPGNPGQPGQSGVPGKPGRLNPVAGCGTQKENFDNMEEEECANRCSPGEPGRRGPKGPKGDNGPSGMPGEPGRPGGIGKCGSKGPRGPPGPMGPHGQRGDPGMSAAERGDPGPKGPPGKAGPKGPPGIPGATLIGRKGPAGRAGRQGEPGTAGSEGPPGPVGPNGLTGICPRECDRRPTALMGAEMEEVKPAEEKPVVVDNDGLEDREMNEQKGEEEFENTGMEPSKSMEEEDQQLAEFAQYEQQQEKQSKSKSRRQILTLN